MTQTAPAAEIACCPLTEEDRIRQLLGLASLEAAAHGTLPSLWVPVEAAIPRKRRRPYQVFALTRHVSAGSHAGVSCGGIYWDWVLRQYPASFRAWVELPIARQQVAA